MRKIIAGGSMMVKHRMGHFLHRRDDVRWKHDPGVLSEFCGGKTFVLSDFQSQELQRQNS